MKIINFNYCRLYFTRGKFLSIRCLTFRCTLCTNNECANWFKKKKKKKRKPLSLFVEMLSGRKREKEIAMFSHYTPLIDK